MRRHPMLKRLDLAVVIAWPILAALLSFLVGANTLVSTLLFFAVPAAYLSYRRRHCIRMAATFSLLFSVPAAIALDYVMEITGGWFIPSSAFGAFRILGEVTLEQLIWLFLYIYLVAMFYEAFLDKACTHRLYWPQLKYFLLVLYFLFGLFIIVHLTKHSLLEIDYFYLKFGIVLGIIPIVFAAFRFPELYGKFFIAGAYFFYVSFIYEITALSLGQWSFPAVTQFIGFVTVAGTQFPLEELLFWIMLGAIAVLSYYKMFGEE